MTVALVLVEESGDVDFGSLRDLVVAEWPPEFPPVSDDEKVAEIKAIACVETDVNKYLVDGGKKVGWYRYSRWPRTGGDGRAAHTLDIVLLPEYRGKGYGRALMVDMIADCGKRGFRNLRSRTFFGNASSIALHRSTGFRESFRTEDSIVWEIAVGGDASVVEPEIP